MNWVLFCSVNTLLMAFVNVKIDGCPSNPVEKHKSGSVNSGFLYTKELAIITRNMYDLTIVVTHCILP